MAFNNTFTPSSNSNDGFADGFNANDSFNNYDGFDGFNNYDGYDGFNSYNGRCSYNTVTYAANTYDVNKRNYSSTLIDDLEHTYWWDRLNAQQTKFGTSQVSRPSVGAGTQLTAAQANALVNGFTNLKSASYSSGANWANLNAIGTVAKGQIASGANYKERIRSTLNSLEDTCRYCEYRSGTT